MSEAEEEPSPAEIDRGLAIPGVALDGETTAGLAAPGVEKAKTEVVESPASKDATFVLSGDEAGVPDVVYSATPDVVPVHCDSDLANEAKDELPPLSPSASSLGASLKFLEGSHLLTYDEMVGMGCQPRAGTQAQVDASGCSSLLTESLLNMSLPERATARGGGEHSDVTSSVDTGYHGGDSEALSSPIGSVDSNLARSKAGATLEAVAGGNLADVVPEIVKMETVQELTERSVSEADLTMREDEVCSDAPALNAAAKKKRTRSPTPASAKVESVPAKRSLTQQRQATGMSGIRRSTNNLKTGSTTSVSGPASARANPSNRKSALSANSSSSLSSSSGTLARRPSSSASSTAAAKAGPAPAKSSGVPARPRKSVSGPDAKKNGREAVDGAGQSTPGRRTSASGGAEERAGGTSRLKAPTMLNRTFAARKTGPGAATAANGSPSTPRSSLRSSVSSTSSGATIPGPSAAAARRRDSQLQRQPSLPKNSRGPVASSTPHVDRSNASNTSAATKSRPLAVTSDAKAVSESPRKPSVSSDRKASVNLDRKASVSADRRASSTLDRKGSVSVDRKASTTMERKPPLSVDNKNSGRNTPLIELREQLASQTTQINAQNEQLASQTAQITAQSEELAAQAEKIASQDSRISELIEESDQKSEELVKTRSQLREAVYSFDIMAIACQNLDTQYRSARQEIEMLSGDLITTQENFQRMEIELNAVISENQLMAEEISSSNDKHEEEIEEINAQHRVTVKAEKLKFKQEKEEALEKLVEQQSAEVKTLKRYHDKELERLRVHYETVMQELKRKHHSDLEEISQRDERHLQELQHQHEKKVAEITHRFEEMKVVLTERVQSLSAEGSDLRSRANQFEENIRRNSDYKLQAVIHQFQHLPEENASLKAVLDLRINENAELRRQNTELQEKLGQLDEAKEKREQLLRQIENLEAIISLKTDNEKQLHDKHQQLLRRYERESKEKKRLSMNYEELLYKLEERQSAEDLTKSSLSDLTSMTSSAVIVRPKTQAAASRQRHRGLQHDRSKRRTIASSRELDP